jgi:hypothetical protein
MGKREQDQAAVEQLVGCEFSAGFPLSSSILTLIIMM